QIQIRIGSQSDGAFLDGLLDEIGIPDIVIDDGSHVMKDVNVTFDYLYPKLLKNSVYLVEDLHTAYWEEYGGGAGKPDSFIERCKHFIDVLNADHSRGQIAPDEFTHTTSGMHFYDSVVVFEKRGMRRKYEQQIGKKLFRNRFF
ncbi:MAG: class I SAM-dependent methyltransferase, partial [Pseudomonadota bacterium]|nr:class I SAM-dependent methyltransferase [Pseudomonadota bacterium]